MTQLTLGKALNAGLRKAMQDDDKVVIMGEDIGKLGGVFRITDGLLDEFGAARVIDTPLAESGIVGTAVGLAYRGYRPVVEIQFDGFVYPAFDQIVSQVAKLHYRTQGRVKMPITIRIPWAGGIGAAEHHSESPEAYFVHTSGLRVIAVSNPEDAYRCLRQAIASDDPVIFVTNALSPAKVQRVTIVDDGERVMEVVVEDKQLSLAIGKKGQNVRLAAKLTGWRIDIKSEEEKRREVEAQFGALELGDGEATLADVSAEPQEGADGEPAEADDALQPIGQPDDAGVATADDDAAKPE